MIKILHRGQQGRALFPS